MDATILAEQIIFRDILIFIFTLDTPQELETGTPEKIWERQLEIEATTMDLKNVMGMATFLMACSERIQELLMSVRLNISFAQNEAVHYTKFRSCQLFKFGKKNKFLLVAEPNDFNEKNCNKLIFKEFLYILTYNFKNQRYYDIFIQLETKLYEIKEQIELNIQRLPVIRSEEDSIMLAIRRDHVDELCLEAKKIETDIKKIIAEYSSNYFELKTVISNLGLEQDGIFQQYLNFFANECRNFKEWLEENQEFYQNLAHNSQKYMDEVTKIIEQLQIESNTSEKPSEKPKMYTSMDDLSGKISIETSPYVKKRTEYLNDINIDTELLDSIPLEWCSSYCVVEPEPKRAVEVFLDLVNGRGKFNGLWFTNQERNKFINDLKLNSILGYQISTDTKEGCMPPVLSKLSHQINDFLATNVHSVIYLDGLDYLISQNDFDRVAKFCNNIMDSIILNDSILIISLNNIKFDKNKLEELMKNSIDISNSEIVLEDILENIY